MHHRSTDSPVTTGRVLHAARWYDLLTRVMSFGRLDTIRNKLIQLAAPSPGEKVLDVGCGTGTLAIGVKAKVGSGEVHGIDASPEMIEVAKKKSASVDFQVALIESIPFPDDSFDLVMSSLMLHHLPEELKRRGLEEIRRVLKSGGRFLAMDLAVPSHSPLGHLRAILGRARGDTTVATLTPMLKAAGFDKVETVSTRHRNFAFIRAR